MSQLTSPFKFLDSYQQDDADIFFGRDKETEALYHALSGVKHLLVYGPSGAGKTSLIECGLRNQFSDADWFALTIRRGANLTTSVYARINEALNEKIPIDASTQLPAQAGFDFGQAIEQLFAERYQPVYLLFDQFEELLISGDLSEKETFFKGLNQLIRHKVPCRVILIMREEFIGHLSEFEPLCPSIFQHRFRLEKMGRSNVREVIRQTLDAPKYRPAFQVKDSESLADSILARLPDEKREIELAHVQVFLGELWERAMRLAPTGERPVLQHELVKTDDRLEGVLDSFLKTQLDELEDRYGEKIPLELLAAMISERHTKLQLSEAALRDDLQTKGINLKKTDLNALLRDLERRRIVRTLKSGDQTQYEISHDILALVVGQNLTEDMKLREKAGDIYRVYEERQGYFTQDDLDYLRPYQQYRPYPTALEARIRKSEAFLHAEQARIQQEKDNQLALAKEQAEKEANLRKDAEDGRKRARLLAFVAGGVAVLAIFAMFLAFSAQKETEKARQVAQERLDAFVAEEQRRKAAEEVNTRNKIESLKSKIRGFIKGDAYGLARDSLKVLESMAPDEPDILVLKSQLK